MSTIYQNIINRLITNHIEYACIEHAPVFTSQEARKLLNHKIEEGTKSLVLKSKNKIVIVTVTENEKVDFKQVQTIINEKQVQMLNVNELFEKIGVGIGAVAPFGYDIDVILLVSKTLFNQENIYINPGVNNVTIKLSGQAFKNIIDLENGIYIN